MTLIIAALAAELDDCRAALIDSVMRQLPDGRHIYYGMAGNQSVALVHTGIGTSNARRVGTLALEQTVPARVFVIGMAGSLDDDIAIGDVVIARDIADGYAGDPAADHGDPADLRAPIYPCDTGLNAALQDPILAKRVAHNGRLVSVSQPITERMGRDALRRRYSAIAVDMESATIAELATRIEVPFVGLRWISDRADAPLDVDACAGAARQASVVLCMMVRMALAV